MTDERRGTRGGSGSRPGGPGTGAGAGRGPAQGGDAPGATQGADARGPAQGADRRGPAQGDGSARGDGAAAGRAPRDGARRGDVPVQATLFDEGVPAPPEEGTGYRGPTACAVAGITYRQLDYWARTGLVTPSVRDASGSGTQRLYSFRDILVLKLVRRLLDTGISLQNIRTAVGQLRAGGAEDLAEITLISDGTTVYECTSPDEVVDLLQGGQGVFAIAVGRVVREVEGDLAELPGERPEDEAPAAGSAADELAAKRRQRGA